MKTSHTKRQMAKLMHSGGRIREGIEVARSQMDLSRNPPIGMEQENAENGRGRSIEHVERPNIDLQGEVTRPAGEYVNEC